MKAQAYTPSRFAQGAWEAGALREEYLAWRAERNLMMTLKMYARFTRWRALLASAFPAEMGPPEK